MRLTQLLGVFLLAGILAPPTPALSQAMFLTAGAVTYLVEPDGRDGGNCGGEKQPCASLTYALTLAKDGDTIRLGPGRYREHEIHVDRSVNIVGAGRDKTILDAERKERVFVIWEKTIVRISDLTVTGGRVTTEPAKSTEEYADSVAGGGIASWGDLTLDNVAVVDNEVIGGAGAAGKAGKKGANGKAGAKGKPTDCRGKDVNSCYVGAFGYYGGNGANGEAGARGGPGGSAWGGGLYSIHHLTVRDSLFADNRVVGGAGGNGGKGGDGGDGGKGGASSYYRDQVVVTRCIAVPGAAGGHGAYGNHGGRGGRGGSAEGGALFALADGDTRVSISNVVIRGNEALAGEGGRGGAGGARGKAGAGGDGGTTPSGCVKPVFSDSSKGQSGKTVEGGDAGAVGKAGRGIGGGIGVDGRVDGVELSNLAIVANKGDLGGGVAVWGHAKLRHLSIVANAANERGGGIYARSAKPEDVAVFNSLVWANTAGKGKASEDPSVDLGGSIQITRWVDEDAVLLVRGSCVEGYSGPGAVANGNLDGCDPGLVEPAGLDGQWGTDDDNLVPGLGSPLIDAADPAVTGSDWADLDRDGDRKEALPLDLNGNPRAFVYPFRTAGMVPESGEARADIGAYEAKDLWTIGEAIEPPVTALDQEGRAFGKPRVEPPTAEAAFYWNAAARKFYAIAPLGGQRVELHWPTSAESALRDPEKAEDANAPAKRRAMQAGTTEWPAEVQRHAAGVAVPLQAADPGQLTFAAVAYPANVGPLVDKLLLREEVGDQPYSVLRFARGPSADLDRYEPVHLVVKAVKPEELIETSTACTVGTPLADERHVAMDGRNGLVLGARAAVDMASPDAAYDANQRRGPIIPVMASEKPTLDVAWFRAGGLGLAWPDLVVRYGCSWPTKAPLLDPLAQEGGEGSVGYPLPPERFPDARLYVQNDPEAAGFNPNDEHAFIYRAPVTEGEEPIPHLVALRNDLTRHSAPYVLVKHRSPGGGGWRHSVFKVSAGLDRAPTEVTVGETLTRPRALELLEACGGDMVHGGPALGDRNGEIWAIAEGRIEAGWSYRLRDDFWREGEERCAPWLDRLAGTPGTPAKVAYEAAWPDRASRVAIGGALREELPEGASASIVHDGAGVRLIDIGRRLEAPLADRPAGAKRRADGQLSLPGLPPHLTRRLTYDEERGTLVFASDYRDQRQLPNVMTLSERDLLLSLGRGGDFDRAVGALYDQGRTLIEKRDVGAGPKLLTAGAASSTGYVTLLLGNGPTETGGRVESLVLQASCPLDGGAVQVVTAPDLFDDAYSLRHGLDFGGNPEAVAVEWQYRAASETAEEAWQPLVLSPAEQDDPSQLVVFGPGRLGRPSALGDVVYRARYSGMPACPEARSDWAQAPAVGWITKVQEGLGPFERRVSDLSRTAIDSGTSLIELAGPAYAGDVSFTGGDEELQSLRMLPAYETVLRRGLALTLEAEPPRATIAEISSILLAAARIADLYALFGHEAMIDAADPTVPAGARDTPGLALSSQYHAFDGQGPVSSLLEEELALLRGLPSGAAGQEGPVFGRLPWNMAADNATRTAYRQVYGIRDRDGDGDIDGEDAAILYPQGHGDAWGHYLSASKQIYRLLRNPAFFWPGESRAVSVAGTQSRIDSLIGERFARLAASKARAGAEIVALTFRQNYAEDPAARNLGLPDPDGVADWALADWASRTGQATYLDWVAANAMLASDCAEDCDAASRSGASDLRDLAGQYRRIEATLDAADQGLNPLGLSADAVPFDIIPDLLDPASKQTHFIQIYERAKASAARAARNLSIFADLTIEARREQQASREFEVELRQREREYKTQLIEIFGRPHREDIGGDGAYPAGYDGPDIYHFDYVAPSLLSALGDEGKRRSVTVTFQDDMALRFAPGSATGPELDSGAREVTFEVSEAGLGLTRPAGWRDRPKDAVGELQVARSEVLQAIGQFRQAMADYQAHVGRIEDQFEALEATIDKARRERSIRESAIREMERLNKALKATKITELSLRRGADFVTSVAAAYSEGLPKSIGTSNDTTSVARGSIRYGAAVGSQALQAGADIAAVVELVKQQDKELVESGAMLETLAADSEIEILSRAHEVSQSLREEPGRRLTVLTQYEAVLGAQQRYLATLGRGERLLQELAGFRTDQTGTVIDARYRDLMLGLLRNEALRTYRQQFDLAARNVYLAVKAFDYEANWSKQSPDAAKALLSRVISSRQLGAFQGDEPLRGNGLADVLAGLEATYQEAASQYRLFQPRSEAYFFSLRRELFRIGSGAAEDGRWWATLDAHRVPDLYALPEFKRCCKPFSPRGPEPGLVIPFWTTVKAGKNFFGWPRLAGEDVFSASASATKLRRVAVVIDVPHLAQPRAYLALAGRDVMRTPTTGKLSVWRVLDQALPIPDPIDGTKLGDQGLSTETAAPARRQSDFPVHASDPHGEMDPWYYPIEEAWSADLAGRSVWNTRWLLIIPARYLGGEDPEAALDLFIGTAEDPGIEDITIGIRAYSHTGN